MSFSQAVRRSLVNFGEVKGRATRSEFIWFNVFALLVGLSAVVVDAVVGTPRMGSEYGMCTAAVVMASLVPGITVTIRRLHDTNKSAWWLLVLFIPCVGFILWLALAAEGSHYGVNQWGPVPALAEPEPPVTPQWRLIAWSAPVMSAVLVASAVGLLATNVGGFGDRMVRNTLPSGQKLPSDLEAGECADLPDGDVIGEISLVPCAKPHEAEVYAVTTLPDGPFPGDRKVWRAAVQYCLPEFEEFTGERYRPRGALQVQTLHPVGETWDVDRKVTCMVVGRDEPLIGTARATPA